jgi:hypothetical protein
MRRFYRAKTKIVIAEELKEIYDSEKKRRVIIYRNNMGTFGYKQEYFSEDPFEMCWIPTGRDMVGFYDSQERAEIEARSNIDWLKDLESITN